MQFYNPAALIFLWLVPVLLAIFWFSQKLWQKRLAKIGQVQTLQGKLMPAYRSSEWSIRAFYLSLAVLFLIMALAQPQWGEEKKKVQRKGVDIVFLLDTSLSMLAEDIRPNRLDKSRLEIKSFVKELKGDRVGMIAFAGSSFLQTPLTLDYSAFMLFLDAIKTGYIPDPGTSIERAVAMAIQSFPPENTKHKAIVLFSDGEDHEGGVEAAIEAAKKAGVRIYTLGTGSPNGDPIPLKDENGRKSGFKKDSSGQVVITKLNQPMLEKIAKDTGGIYLPSTPAEDEIKIIIKHMESLGQKQFKEQMVAEKEDHFQFFIFWALVFLCVEMLVSRRKKIKPDPAVIAIIAFFLFNGFIDTAGGLNKKANEQFEQKKYQSAEELYQKALVKNPDDPSLRYNLGTTFYQTKDYQDAQKNLEKSISKIKDPELKAKALYNYGNTQYRLGNFEKAIDSYKKALEINPNDKDAKYNLEFLQNKKGSMDKKNQDRQNDKQNKDQNQQNQNQNQQQQNQQDQQQNQQDQQQNQQDQQQKQDQQQNQDQKDQQNQPQNKDQQQDQKDQQNQEQQNQQDQQKDQKDQQPQDQNQGQGQKSDEQKEQEKKDQQNQEQKEQEQKEQEQKEQQEQEKKEQEQRDQQQKEQEEQEQKDQEERENESPQQQGQQQSQGSGRRPLQGQMTMESALQVLDALKESEKELQDLRRPQPMKDRDHQVLKDW